MNGAMYDLAFAQLRDINLSRCLRWQPKGLHHWSLDDWLVALGGEVGEILNIVKKLNRSRDGMVGNSASDIELSSMLADEIADAVIYLDLTLVAKGFDFGGRTGTMTFANLRAFRREWPLPETLSAAGTRALVALGSMAIGHNFFPAGFALLCRLDELAALAGIDLGAAVARKFNATSEKHGFPERLPTPGASEA